MTAPGAASVFAGFRFPREVISVAAGWYLRSGLSSRDVGKLLAERGITAGHVTVYRWVRRFTPEFIAAARPGRHVRGNRWLAEETDRGVAGRWACVYRAVDQQGQVIDVLVSARRDLVAARRLFSRARRAGTIPAQVTTGRAAVYPPVTGELIPSALPTVERYANNPVQVGHGRRTARLRPVRGLTRHRSAWILNGHAFVPNLRRGHHDIAMDVPARHQLRLADDDLATTSDPRRIQVILPWPCQGRRNATVPPARLADRSGSGCRPPRGEGLSGPVRLAPGRPPVSA